MANLNLNNLEKIIRQNRVASVSSLDTGEFKDILRQKTLAQYLKLTQNQSMESNPSNASNPQVIGEKISFFKRYQRILMPIGVTTVIALIGLSAYLTINKDSDTGNNRNSKKTLAAEVVYTEGSVEYKNQEGNWQKATIGTNVDKEGISVKTGNNSKAIVNIDDGSAVRLNADTEITFISLKADNIVINNTQGEIYSRVVKSDRIYEITIDDAKFISLGTAYKTINESTKKGVEVYNSQVKLITPDNQETIIDEGKRLYTKDTEKPQEEGKVATIDQEALKKDDFILWNKEQDEKDKDYKENLGILEDIISPALEITQPADGAKTSESKITIKGNTENGAIIKVNGSQVGNDSGSFSAEVALNVGANKITVYAIDAAGNKTIKEITVTRESTETPPPVNSTASITLTGSKTSTGVSLKWTVNNVETSKGFKIVKSTSPNPVYPGNDYQYLTNGATRSYTWSIKDGKTYHFRICQYLENGTCGLYSNDITVTAPTAPTSDPVTLNLTANTSTKKVSWTITGVSEQGFKVVWSKTANPVYPNRDSDRYQYFSNADQRISDVLEAFNGSGTYYVRVCEYLGGSCGVYSNQVTIEL